ncbi:MAG: DEAD/DEAH box helicase [Muribaculaceae bacterium]|nr:DEAD/DEAH box helicase [Muribaculaceae bacterium]
MKQYEGRAGLLVLGTGLGKTRIFTEYLRWAVTENDWHCLILSHREELVYQPLEYLKDIRCGVELGSRHAHGEYVISASVQSLVGRLHDYDPRSIDVIIVDEAHHAAAPTYRKIIEHFSSAAVFGFTATAHRGDGVGLAAVFTDLLFERDTLWAIENGHLCGLECRQVALKYDMGSVRIREDGDFNQADVAKALSGTAAGVVEVYNRYARGPAIIFAASLAEVRDITYLLNKQADHIIAAAITGQTRNRAGLLNGFEAGILKVLVNFGVLTEGVDTCCAETILIARPIAHTNCGLYAQMVGRGLRKYPGKKSCLVIDCVGISETPICTAATLIGKELPPPKKKKPASDTPLPDGKDVFELLTSKDIPETWVKNEKEVSIPDKGIGSDMHDVAWTKQEDGGFILRLPGITYRITAPLEDGAAYLWRGKKCSKAPMPPQFLFDFVFTDLMENHANTRSVWDKSQRKRWDGQPPTEAQRKLILQLSPGYDLAAAKLTRGDASALIQTLLYAQSKRRGGKNNAS